MTEQLATETPPVDPAVLNAGDPPPVDPPQQKSVPESAPPQRRMVPEDIMISQITPLRSTLRETENRLAEANRKLREQEELFARMQRGNGSEPAATPPPAPRQPEQQLTDADVTRRAMELNFQRDAQHIIAAGKTTYGEDWNSSVSLLATFGLDTPDFVTSIMEVAGRDKTHEVVRAITADLSIVAAMGAMSPARRIAEITRVSERMNAKPATAVAPAQPVAPPARNVSKAPPPAPRVEANASKIPDWNTEQDKMSDAEWSREWNDRWSKRAGRR